MDKNRLSRQMAFLEEIDKEKKIQRVTELSDGSRRETDAEHAWHMAIMALILSEYANEEIDVLKTVSMLLIHDLVEIDAGDTYAYDTEGLKTQREREEKAADRLYGMLPDDQRDMFRALFEEFEAAETPEARFAKALDNVQPSMLTATAGGGSWKERGVRLSQVLGRNAVTPKGSEALWDYSWSNYLGPNVKCGNIMDDTEGGDSESNSNEKSDS